MTTEEIRNQVKQALGAIDPAALSLLSSSICFRFTEECARAGVTSEKWRGLRVGLYRAMPREFDLTTLDRTLREAGARVHFPRILDRKLRTMEYVEVPTYEQEAEVWDEGPYGLQEPHSRFLAAPPDVLDVIFTAGLAFGEKGERIGRGLGHFDRFIAGNPRALRVALVPDFQVFAELPQNPWDRQVDWVFTETRDLRNPRASRWLASAGRPDSIKT